MPRVTMDAFRQSRCLVRVLAAWLLVWFCVMSVPLTSGVADDVQRMARPGGGNAAEIHHHTDDAPAPLPAGHGEHGAGASQHCPLCLHAAAPAMALPALALPRAAPQEDPAPVLHAWQRVRTDTPPPARAPPLLS